MQSSTLDFFTRQRLVDLIGVYQKRLSPKKGFSCPHRLLYGEQSCSEHIKGLLSEQSLVSAMPQIYQRFQACASAGQTLKLTRSSGGCIIIPCCVPI